MTGLKSEFQLAARDGAFVQTRTVLWLGHGIQRFDYSVDGWVDDPEMGSIFIGSPEVRPLSEAEAREVIVRNGGTWVAPH